MSTQNVDFALDGATLDTGEEDATAIRPILNGEPAVAAVLTRPDENLRHRTEVLRDEVEDVKYLADADRILSLSGGGTFLWNGTVAGGGGGDGKFSITSDMLIRPFLATATSTKARAVIRGVAFETVLAGPVVPRAYNGANKFTVELQGSNGATLAVAISGTPGDNILITVDTHPASGTTKQQLVDFLNLDVGVGPAAYRALGLVAALDTGAVGTDKVNDTGVWLPSDFKQFAGAIDAERHIITPAGLSTFFGDALNVLTEGDTIAIWYDSLVNGLAGGRRESMSDLPENSANADANLFLLRRFPERMPLAIPIATVTNNQLRLINGGIAVKSSPIDFGNVLVDDANLIGGVRVVANAVARQAISLTRQKANMWVLQADTKEVYRLQTLNEGAPVFVRLFTLGSGTDADRLTLDKVFVNGPAGLLDVQDNAGAGGLRVRLAAELTRGGTIGPMASAFNQAWGAVNRSHVARGCQLQMDVEDLGGGNEGPKLICGTGNLVTAGGTPVTIGAILEAGASAGINGVAMGAGPATIYGFVRRDTGSGLALRWHTDPPDEFGRPAVADATYTVNDYAYVGFARYIDNNNAGAFNGVWGKQRAIHLGNGLREWVFDPVADAGAKDTPAAIGLTTGTPGTFTSLLTPGAVAGVAVLVKLLVRFWWTGAAGFVTGLSVAGPGCFAFSQQVFDVAQGHMQRVIDLPISEGNGNPEMGWYELDFGTLRFVGTSSSAAGAGSINYNCDFAIWSIIENVNEIKFPVT